MNEGLSRITALFQKKNVLFAAGLCGILLIFLSDTLFSGEDAGPAAEESVSSSYLAEMRSQLEDSISEIEGAGNTRVFLTLEDGGTSIFAQDEQSSTDTQMEDGVMTGRTSSRTSEYVLADGGPVLESSLEPVVKGVSVVCEGGDDIKVIARVTEFVSVGLGISTNRICVTKMK